ncbi:Ankyrin repeats (3 copies) [Stieleria maiorica]|uniref:Ankyrin repeats (3 copies) n=1 Tax=Stieleria maiorica TaxID=2795974 RepID=A0A5B9MCR8_9BACT|nr:ankyrin repeat domain-containing protein [Stieleria maiorica]QEF99032.1 Ankyrin repeats (3 copies) [Stieleria maiorica]
MNAGSQDLKRAAFDGDLDTVRRLVESGVDVNATESHGSGTLLNFHPHITEYLLAMGADPNRQANEHGASVLAGLCYVNQVECARLLLQHGAVPDRGRDETLETPLHHGLAGDAGVELVELLIRHGADLNAVTKPGIVSCNFYGQTPTRGETPLHRAAAYASMEIVQRLVDAGGDREIADSDGYLPYHWAGWHRRSKELVLLLRPW